MLLFYFSRPKYHYGTGKNKDSLKDHAPTWFTKRKDLDNLIKFVLDSLNGQAYFDDSQVVAIHAYKFYTNKEPRVEVRLRKNKFELHENGCAWFKMAKNNPQNFKLTPSI